MAFRKKNLKTAKPSLRAAKRRGNPWLHTLWGKIDCRVGQCPPRNDDASDLLLSNAIAMLLEEGESKNLSVILK